MCRQHAELIELREEMSDLNYAVGILELWRQQAERMASDCLPEAIRFTEAETRARIASIDRQIANPTLQCFNNYDQNMAAVTCP